MIMWQLSIEDITVHAGLYEENSAAFKNLQVCHSSYVKKLDIIIDIFNVA